MYSDADYASDKSDRKSTYSNILLLGGGLVSWSSKKQKSVSTSMMETEYVALSKASNTTKWASQFLKDTNCYNLIGPTPYTVQMVGDNQGTIDLVHNMKINEQNKHIDVAYKNTTDMVKNKFLKLSYVSTNKMTPDGLTKLLQGEKHKIFLKLIELCGYKA